MEDVFRIFAAFMSTTVFAALLGLGLSVASRRLHVEKDKAVENLNAILPGLNCGACGYAGCELYAEALVAQSDTSIDKCSPGGASTRQELSNILGLEDSGSKERTIAHLACLGGDDIAVREFQYNGYADCESAYAHFEGSKGCKYGCLGLGSCVKVCPVDAIDYTSNGLVKVNAQSCIGCEICVAVCPTGVMTMIPENARWLVACNSRDTAKATKSFCRAGCIGCRICERKFPDAGFIVEDNLSHLGYTENKGEGYEAVAAVCPPKCIIKIKDD